MNRELAMKIADAVLYEGYMLYPYRPSAIKNRQRWTFGILYPPSYEEVIRGTERSGLHTECLLQAERGASVQIQLRFLQLAVRQINRNCDGHFEPVPSLVVDQNLVEGRDEGIERSAECEFGLGAPRQSLEFSFPGNTDTEVLQDKSRHNVGSICRTQHQLQGSISAATELVRDRIWKLTMHVTNNSSYPADTSDRDAALLRSLLSAHTIVTAVNGEFVSLLETPNDLRDAARVCLNIGNFPVLVGAEGERDMLLCSPILLYDYPQIAPESAGDFYDATEMDEMLTLRVMTLTDQEKDAMRLGDDRLRALLERTEQTARDQLIRTHGTIRSLHRIEEEP